MVPCPLSNRGSLRAAVFFLKKVAQTFGACGLCVYLYTMSNTNKHTMNTITFTTRQVADNAFEVVMRDEYPVTLNTYNTQIKAEEVAAKLRTLAL